MSQDHKLPTPTFTIPQTCTAESPAGQSSKAIYSTSRGFLVSSVPINTTSDRPQEKLRQLLAAAPALRRIAQSARAVIHFGPWRQAARAIIRRLRPPEKDLSAWNCALFSTEASQLLADLLEQGCANAGTLPPDALCRIQAISDHLPPGEYGEFQVAPDIDSVTQSATEIAREYLRAEPALVECTLFVSSPENPSAKISRDSDRHFHFEDAGWHSLSLFVYLTDVSMESGAHQLVAGTHRGMKFRDAIRGMIPEDEVLRRYPDQLRSVIGPPGTMFFEDTSTIHRRRLYKTRHVILHILFVSHRSWSSRGRRIRTYSEYLRAHRDITAHLD